MDDTRLRELVVDAYRDVRLDVPLATIEAAATRTRPRTLAAAAAGVMVVAFGAYFGAGGPSPVAAPSVAASVSSSPTATAAEACVRSERITLPPLRFTMELDALILDVYADERVEAVCFRLPQRTDAGVTRARGVTDVNGGPVHPAGHLSNTTSTAILGELTAVYSFGRAPAGTTKVEIRLADGSAVAARLAGEWYLAAATGDAARRLATATSVVATTPNRTYTIPVH